MENEVGNLFLDKQSNISEWCFQHKIEVLFAVINIEMNTNV